jgi:hypothetical protein
MFVQDGFLYLIVTGHKLTVRPLISYHGVMSTSLPSVLVFILFCGRYLTLPVVDSCGMGSGADFSDSKIMWSYFRIRFPCNIVG